MKPDIREVKQFVQSTQLIIVRIGSQVTLVQDHALFAASHSSDLALFSAQISRFRKMVSRFLKKLF